ncbi:hypothetical protein BGW36DRAFT_369363 [Talaromyces proteolyticus]|uniref:DUF7907 domain-containing protein n=1 Tax=Talaromyces proteolyticus TaxID=1131652 RepID=A0AAD4KXN8_9EURO|nr:uncharacterized protein BGW36DRAFT_369363 [Talaromyces proteolyticus]KAH8703451.1 hypothetical protein BGW36DRAFT_369363 [Talaromyces proteolyticus]
MLFSQIVLTAASLAASVIAAPNEFRIKTVSSSASKNGLYVESYHTGAGLADPVLTTSTANAGKFYLNNTYLQQDIGQEFSYGFELGGATNYAGWEFVEVNAGQGVPGFVVQNGNIVWNSTESTGWLACDWWHGAPQLFWSVAYENFTRPISCSTVSLTQEFISS